MNEERFTGKAEFYDKYRPSYPDSLIDWLYERTNAATVADIGAGTGKFTACLLRKPWKVTAVEPNDDMRSKLNIPGVNVVKGSAENTGLEQCSIELITTAQAFHWFDRDKFKSECQRILKPEGSLAVVYNERKDNDYSKERDEIFLKYCGACNAGAIGGSKEKFEDIFDGGYFSSYEVFKLENNTQLDLEGFIGRELSSSYALKENDPKFPEFKKELEKLFQKYQENGSVRIKGDSVCYLGKF